MKELSDIPDERDIGWEDDAEFMPPMAAGHWMGAPNDDDVQLLRSTVETPRIRERLHAMCALYVHAGTIEQRLKLLDRLEDMTLQLAHIFAIDLLDAGWLPDEGFDRAQAVADLGILDPRTGTRRAA